ncbi:hypothetical protein H7I77_25315 [Mycolicibacterium novocastrense]|uniref:Uncharacterized protein n=1 Tax=Mycolicibacterium novocastrense TaxID=59813 RepID=A0AAW5SSX4_MYCNV|nr:MULTISPECIES: hypothetical protein [Mycolicibacterium]MCV7026631.1 hypothetical protein [Mycolicibacterium novocastrense]MDX1887503.1 hypothetical protein [Mycolicibacterium sp. 120270]GAT07616.1 putative uncharacterized protein [Mycolicibacterium novocastrense]
MDALNKFVRWSPEVKEFLGPDALTTLCRSAGDYTCITCSKPGKATRERTSVIVVKGTPEAPPVVQLAHARCAPSQIITLDTATIDPDNPSINLDEDIISVTMLWQAADGPLAGLILDRHAGISLIHGSGDREDLWVQFLLEKQWALVLDPAQNFPLITTGTIELNRSGQGRVVSDPAGTVLLDPLPDPSEQWVSAALDRGLVRVYAGDVGISDHPDHDVQNTLFTAISAGRIAGAYLPVTRLA